MDVLDLVVGMLLTVAIPGVPVLGIAAAALALTRTRGRSRMVALALSTVGAAGLATCWWAWGVGFDAADAYREVPGWVDPVMIGSAVAAVAAFAGLVGVAISARTRSTAPAVRAGA